MQDDDELGIEQGQGPGPGLRLFGWCLGVGNVVLVLGTALAVPLLILALTGRGTITVPAKVDPPYTVEFADGTGVEATGESANWINLPEGEEQRYLDGAPSVLAQIKLDRDDTGARGVLAVGVGTWLALFWLGLINVRRVVRSALDGKPFDAGNVGRLRWLGAAVLGFPVVGLVMVRALEAGLEVAPPVHVQMSGPSWWVYVVIGAGVLALAEVFREGSRLRALEDATI